MTSSSTPSTRPVMSSSVACLESRIVTTVGVVEKYISTSMRKVVPWVRSAMFTEFRPAVRVERDWKRQFQNVSQPPRSFRDCVASSQKVKACEPVSRQSNTEVWRKTSVTATISSQSVCTAGNMCVKQRRGCSRRKSSTCRRSESGLVVFRTHQAMSRTMMGRKVLPRATSAPVVFSSRGLHLNSITEDGVMTRPLFWKAETVRYAACQWLRSPWLRKRCCAGPSPKRR
mmetsp:Transcript_24429/g.76831  ORF Transcript_24429/g.76831 Transcript_24429/m.76831 type:complete len:229 (+) Transcript_24429:456-1142(+)